MKLQRRVLACATTLLLLSGGSSFAAHPMITDDAETLGKGTIQIELNGDIGTEKQSNGGGSIGNVNSSPAQIASTVGTGVTDKIDITLGLTRPWGSGYVAGFTFNDAGSVDFTLAMKWQVFEHDGYSAAVKPQLGYSYAVNVPEDDHTLSYGATLILTKEFGPFAVHLNAGYTYNDYNLAVVRGFSRSDIWSVSMAATYEIIKQRLKLCADFGTSTNPDKTVSEVPVYGLGGIIYTVNKNLDLSAGAKFGLTNPETDFTGTFGVTLKF
jgi:hypothetical protein